MKLAVELPNPLNRVARITLDGKPVREAVEVDDESGYVVVHKRHADGSLVVENDSTVLERLTGDVVITYETGGKRP